MPALSKFSGRIALLLALSFSSVHFAQAQKCNLEWTMTQDAPLRNVNRPTNVLALPGALYKLKYDKKNCGCGMPTVAVSVGGIKNGYTATSVSVKLRGYECDGKPREDEFYAHNVQTGQWDAGTGNMHWFRDLTNIAVLRVEIEYYDREFQATYKYVTDYQTGFDETYINNRPWRDILADQEKARKELAEKQKEEAKEKDEAKQQEIQKQKEQLAQQQEKQRQDQQRQRQEQARAQENQRRQYQSQADADINAAGNNASPIGSVADLNNAEINAAAAGNTAQVQEIERMKSQQTQQQTAELTDAAGQLANSIIDISNSFGRNRYSGPSPREMYHEHIDNLKSSGNPEDLMTVATNYAVEKKDYVSEAKYLEMAAKLGSIEAMHRLIFFYTIGDGKTYPQHEELTNKWLSVEVDAAAQRISDEYNQKTLTVYEKNAWQQSTMPGDNNEISAITSVAGDLIPSEKVARPMDSLYGPAALAFLNLLNRKYGNNYLSLSSSNFNSLVLSQYFLARMYARNLDKTKPEAENMKMAVATYHTFKEMVDNYSDKGADIKWFHPKMANGWLKDLKSLLKKRLKELNMQGDYSL